MDYDGDIKELLLETAESLRIIMRVLAVNLSDSEFLKLIEASKLCEFEGRKE